MAGTLQEAHRQVANMIWAAYETGNKARGDSLLREYEALHPDEAKIIRRELHEGYNEG